MQAGGLDGWLRRVPAGDARPSSLASGLPIWKFNTSQHQALTRALADFLLLDGHHVFSVDGPGLHKLLKLAEPRFEPPSRTYIQHVCLNVFRGPHCIISVSISFFLFRLTFQICIGKSRKCRRSCYMIHSQMVLVAIPHHHLLLHRLLPLLQRLHVPILIILTLWQLIYGLVRITNVHLFNWLGFQTCFTWLYICALIAT